MTRIKRMAIIKEEFQNEIKKGEYSNKWDFESYLQFEYKEAQNSNSCFGRKKETFEEWIITRSNWILKKKELEKESEKLRKESKKVKKNEETGMTVQDAIISGFDEDQAKMIGIDSDL